MFFCETFLLADFCAGGLSIIRSMKPLFWSIGLICLCFALNLVSVSAVELESFLFKSLSVQWSSSTVDPEDGVSTPLVLRISRSSFDLTYSYWSLRDCAGLGGSLNEARLDFE